MEISEYKDILRKYWGYDDFRGIQRDIIESIGNGHDTLGLMPTGGGKSITFQVPALATKGVCIVITPLIALMKDQVANLRQRGIKAAAIYAGLSREEIVTILENAVFGAVKLLYVSPERLASEIFIAKLKHMEVSFITIDEAHCISQWGYDFRPSYLKIADIRAIKPDAPVLALTATATPTVVDDIQERLGFKEKRVFRMSFERSNLAYVVRKAEDKRSELIHILHSVKGSAIVYARSRKKTKEVADMLNNEGLSATFYHAGLENATKDQRQKAWKDGTVRTIVATNAFGMGIDKPDVRIVIHIDCPDSIEAYFQEAGRAGRDEKKAYAVLLYNNGDKAKLHKRIADNFPEKEYIKDVYEHLAYFFQIAVGAGFNSTFEFNIEKFCHTYHFYPLHVDATLKILDRAGYIEYNEEQEQKARIMFTVCRDDLYRLSNNSKEEDNVVIALLRTYGGLFCDYCYIEESLLAQHTGLKENDVHNALKALSQKRIISFIPQKTTPTIRYTQRREDTKDIILPKEVYEDRKKDFTERVKAMIYYAHTDNICRSRLLLSYFGEKKTKDCKQCDVCLDKKGRSKEDIEKAEKCIIEMLNDGQSHNILELKNLSLPTDVVDTALSNLFEQETIHQINGSLYKD